MPYEIWKGYVNFLLIERVGLSSEDLENAGEAELIAMHEQGLSPQAAADNIIGGAELFNTSCEDCE